MIQLSNFWHDQDGAIVSIEIVLIVTVAVLSLVVGLSEVAVAVNTELNDISNAVGAVNQSYGYTGFSAKSERKLKSFAAGSSYHDRVDDCDNDTSCDIVCGVNPWTHED